MNRIVVFLGCVLFSILSLGQSLNLFKVAENNQYGLIDEQGKVVVPLQYDEIESYKKSLFVKKNNQWKHILNQQGELGSKSYDSVRVYFNKLFAFSQQKISVLKDNQLTELIQTDSIEILPSQRFKLWVNGYAILMTKEGQLAFQDWKISDFEWVEGKKYEVYQGSKVGVGTSYHHYILPIEYDSLRYYGQGILFYQNGKLGYQRFLNRLTKDGQSIDRLFFPAEYDWISYYGKDYIECKKDGKRVLYDLKQSTIINADFPTKAQSFVYLFHKRKELGKYALLDYKGNDLTAPTYDKMWYSPNHRIVFQDGKEWGILDSLGNELTRIEVNRIFPFKARQIYDRSFTKYEQDTLFGLIHKDGEILTDSLYLSIELLEDDRAICMRKDSSVRVFFMNNETGFVDDWYDLATIKQMRIDRNKEWLFGVNHRVELVQKDAFSYYAWNMTYEGKTVAYNTGEYILFKTDTSREQVFSSLGIINHQSKIAYDTIYNLISGNQLNDNFGRITDTENYYNNFYKSIQYLDDLKIIHCVTVTGKNIYYSYEGRYLPWRKTLREKNIHNRDITKYWYRYLRPTEFNKEYTPSLLMLKTGNEQSLLINTGRNKWVPSTNNTFIQKKKWLYTRIDGKLELLQRIDTLQSDENLLEVQFGKGGYVFKKPDPYFYYFTEKGQNHIKSNRIEELVNSSSNILIKEKGKYNYLQKNGKWLLENPVEKAYPFKGNYANFKKDGKNGVINHKGKVVIPAEYRTTFSFNKKGVSIVRIGKEYGLIDTLGNMVDTIRYNMLRALKKSNLFFYKKVAITSQGSVYGLLTSQGKVLTEQVFKKVFVAKNSEQYAIVSNPDNLQGIISIETGQTILEMKYAKITSLGNECFSVQKGEKEGVYHLQKKWVLSPKYQKITRFKHGFLTAKHKKSPRYVLEDGTVVAERPEPIKQEKVVKEELIVTDTYKVTKENELVGVSSLDGKEIVPHRFQKITILENGVFEMSREFTYDVYDWEGNLQWSSNIYCQVTLQQNGMLQVITDNGIAYFNLNTKKWVWNSPRSTPL